MPFKSMSGWSGGVCNFYKNENGIYTVSTYVTNSNSDGAGKDIALSKFV